MTWAFLGDLYETRPGILLGVMKTVDDSNYWNVGCNIRRLVKKWSFILSFNQTFVRFYCYLHISYHYWYYDVINSINQYHLKKRRKLRTSTRHFKFQTPYISVYRKPHMDFHRSFTDIHSVLSSIDIIF